MIMEIKESDWKVFRRLQKVALERFCERVLNEIRSAAGDGNDGCHDRYLKVFDLVQNRDKAIGRMFNGARRSNALVLLTNIKSEGLLTADELAQLSPEARQAIERVEYIRRA